MNDNSNNDTTTPTQERIYAKDVYTTIIFYLQATQLATFIKYYNIKYHVIFNII